MNRYIFNSISILITLSIIIGFMVMIILTSCKTKSKHVVYQGVVDYVVRTAVVDVIDNHSNPVEYAAQIAKATETAEFWIKNNNALNVMTIEDQFRDLIEWNGIDRNDIILLEVLLSAVGREFLENDHYKDQVTQMAVILKSIHHAAISYTPNG